MSHAVVGVDCSRGWAVRTPAESIGGGRLIRVPDMNAGTFLVRSTALVGIASTFFWTVGFAWVLVQEPPLFGLTVVAVLLASGVVLAAKGKRPGMLSVPDETEFQRTAYDAKPATESLRSSLVGPPSSCSA